MQTDSDIWLTADEEDEKRTEINFDRGQEVLILNCSLTSSPDKVNW